MKKTPIAPIYFILFVLLSITACKDTSDPNRRAEKMPPALASYIYAHTSGMITNKSPIRVRFVDPVVADTEVGKEVPSGLLTFSPAIKGKSIWENQRTLTFQPEEWLHPGATYIATLRIRDLIKDLHPSISRFEFDFRTREQYMDVKTEGLETTNQEDFARQELKGMMHTGDVLGVENPEEVLSGMLTAAQGGQKLPIQWLDWDSENMGYPFVVTEIMRKDVESKVLLEWNGQSGNIAAVGKKEIVVPSLQNFVVNEVEVINGEEPHIIVYFSDPIKKNQDFNGMFAFSENELDVTTVVDGNQVKIYPAGPMRGKKSLSINTGIENVNGKKLSKNTTWNVEFFQEKPQVKLVGQGSILPENDGLIFPFDAVGLNAVDIEVFKIYDSNILQFLQTNNLEGSYEMKRVGEVVFQKKYLLSDINPKSRPTAMMRYAVDLKKLIVQEPGAIYQVRIGFRQSYAEYACDNTDNFEDEALVAMSEYDDEETIKSIWKDYYRYYDGYKWQHREDPCYPAYYRSHNFVRRNVLASNIGMIAKQGGNKKLKIIVADIRTAYPLSGAQVKLYDYAQQEIGTAVTDGDGVANFESVKKDPFVAVANFGNQSTYLKLFDQYALSQSRFDVGGVKPQKGLKGYIYGERGVWRPGDSLYLNFVLEDEAGTLPQDHPIYFSLKDPRGQLQEEFTTAENVNGVYPIHLKTDADDPTGNWRAQVQIGGARFSKTLKIETVKPNRLKINLDFGKDELTASDENLKGDLQVNWLHGAPARNLKTTIETQMRTVNTTFSKYKTFEFDDPSRRLTMQPKKIFDGKVNERGNAKVTADLGDGLLAPGKMKVAFKTRAFEAGGDFSSNNFSMTYHPYTQYTGVEIPRNEYNSKRIDMKKDERINFVVVDTDGKPVSNASIDVGLYRVQWRWWWDSNRYGGVSQYNSSKHTNALKSAEIHTNSEGEASYTVNVKKWGRYMIRACNTETGHCTGDFFYAGYPWYENNDGAREAAAMLHFTSEKEKYDVGEDIVIKVPASENSRCLISLETGNKVIRTFWEDAQAGSNVYKIRATKEMAPNVYVNVTLLQPHGQDENDLGVRMYGVIPVMVDDPATILKPEIAMEDVLKPEAQFKVTVSEQNDKPMAYTIAVVDDGLLDLTNFKTPNPWNTFYAKEALGVHTWDMYDYVLGAYNGGQGRILAIGGDGEINKPSDQKQANRFKPVVMHLGPFYLEPGGKATHELTMPNYVGSVRTMVVASGDGAYGSVEKTTPVKKPLMILATLPRVLGPTETLSLPVNVFAMEDKVKNVTVKVQETSGLASFTGGTTNTLSFSSIGDQITSFDFKVSDQIGIAKFLVTATSGNERATQEIEIQVRNPNPFVTNVYDGVVQPNETWSKEYRLVGMRGTNQTTMEVSAIPPMNLEKRLDYLIRYPHGCVEQTTSGAFPQLFLHRLTEVSPQQRREIVDNIGAAVDRLRKYQRNDGSFTYWPGEDYWSDFGTNYAGHFLVEARDAGYSVPANMINLWTKAQSRLARNWRVKDDGRYKYARHSSYLNQAYRLYTLALAKVPEWGAMNRLKEDQKLPLATKWRLALAYAVAGKPEIASGIIDNLATSVEPYQELSGSYGSNVRDEAMILETLTALNRKSEAVAVMRSIADHMGKDYWYSTQTTAYSLLAVAKFLGDAPVGKELKFAYQHNGGSLEDAGSNAAIMQIDLPGQQGGQSAMMKNNSQNVLFVRVIQSGQPIVGDPKNISKNLKLNINYVDVSGKTIDPARIEQGTDFIARVTVTNPGSRNMWYEELALTQIFPSGWEIQNARMSEVNTASTNRRMDYQDVRDDRAYTYFDLGNNKSTTFEIQLNAAYPGRYYLPNTSCEAMYDHTIQASDPGMWVEVVKAEVN